MLKLRLVLVASSGAGQALPVIGECGRRDISVQYNRAINNLETFLCNKGPFLLTGKKKVLPQNTYLMIRNISNLNCLHTIYYQFDI